MRTDIQKRDNIIQKGSIIKPAEGVRGIKPVIKNVSFTQRGKMTVELKDGREITVPLRYFPSVQEIPAAKRSAITIVEDELILFHHGRELIHIEQLLGTETDYEARPM